MTHFKEILFEMNKDREKKSFRGMRSMNQKRLFENVLIIREMINVES